MVIDLAKELALPFWGRKSPNKGEILKENKETPNHGCFHSKHLPLAL
jgi:hypothetical protein